MVQANYMEHSFSDSVAKLVVFSLNLKDIESSQREKIIFSG